MSSHSSKILKEEAKNFNTSSSFLRFMNISRIKMHPNLEKSWVYCPFWQGPQS